MHLDDLEALIQASQLTGNNVLGNQRIITNPTNAMGILRHDLISTIGLDRTKAFILRYGWNCGVSDGLRIKELDWASEKEILWAGPKMYMIHGYAYTEPQITRSDFENGKLHFEGILKNSYEAEQHIRLFGLSDFPVCYNLVGYASGYLSMVMGRQVIAKEVECEGKGDEHCRWVCKTAEEWDEEPIQEIAYFETLNISDELTKMYDTMKIERDNLQAAIQIHNKLMEKFLNGSHLNSFADVTNQVTNIPVIIEDEEFNPIASAGLDSQEANLYSRSFKHWMSQQGDIGKKSKIIDLTEKNQTVEIVLSYENKRLITPINLGQSVRGYCSFINSSFKEVDSLILKQLAVTCALYLFNVRTIFETEQRLKGSFLEDILNQRLSTQEIYKKANYLGVDLGQNYHLLVLEKLPKSNSGKENIEISEENLIPSISKYFKDRDINLLLTQQSHRIVALFPIDRISRNFIKVDKFLGTFLNFLNDKFPKCKFKLGVSSKSNDIKDAPTLYDESLAASNLANYQKDIAFFDDLGIVGVLFQSGKLDNIRTFCNKTLGNLLEYDRCKKSELTKTLFFYIKNGFNLYQAAREMNMSIGGMRYRLQKLQEILEVDINDPQTSFQIFLALQSSIVLGDIDIM